MNSDRFRAGDGEGGPWCCNEGTDSLCTYWHYCDVDAGDPAQTPAPVAKETPASTPAPVAGDDATVYETGERLPIPASDTPDGYCGSHAWALQQKPDGEMWEDASLPCGEGGATEAEGGCASKYQYVTNFATAQLNDGATFDCLGMVPKR